VLGHVSQNTKRDDKLLKPAAMVIMWQVSLAVPSWVGAMSTSQRAVTLCGWGVKAGMVRVWVAGRIV